VDKKIIETNKNQSEIFFNVLDSFLVNNNIDINNIDKFYFACGPGSFTGIRVGLTFAKALACSNKNKVYTISSLDMLLGDVQNGIALIDARGNKYYVRKKEDNIFKEIELINKDDLVNDNYITYDSSLDNIPNNIIYLVNNNYYSDNIESLYVKAAF
jgi:tRNA threonylcarbamoyl adenosine modification protein YeaZ